MTEPSVLDLWREGLSAAATVAGPFLLSALAVGLVTSLIQAATQIQENVLSFVPKLIAVGLVLALGGNFLLDRLSRYATTSIEAAATIGRDGDRE